MMRLIIFSSLVLFAAFSGCVGDEAKPASTSESTTPSSTGNSTASPTPSDTAGATTTTAAANTPPTANLSSDVPNGTAPLNVTFTIEGDDEDGDELSWTLDADGDGTADYNGTELPDEIVHEYVEPGNYTAVLNVTDGTDSAESNVTIAVEVAAVTGPNICHRKPTQTVGPLYVLQGDGGDWIFRESNNMPGLQVANNHPSGQGSFTNPAWVGCVQGDQMLF